MSNRIRAMRIASLLAVAILVLSIPVHSDPLAYQQEFVREVIEFAKLNRLRSALHRDVHADCYIRVIAATTILRDGSAKDVSIERSSTVPT